MSKLTPYRPVVGPIVVVLLFLAGMRCSPFEPHGPPADPSGEPAGESPGLDASGVESDEGDAENAVILTRPAEPTLGRDDRFGRGG
jgi:hypothetical protein